MKKFLLLSHYAPKPGFKYLEHDCPLAHRETAHQRIYDLERFWPEGVLWRTIEMGSVATDELEGLLEESWDAVWLSGSPYLLSEAEAHPWINQALETSQKLLEVDKHPVIGLCFGLQLLAAAVGGKIEPTEDYIIGETNILSPTGETLVRTKAYHENYVAGLPSSAEILGTTENGLPYLVQFSKKVLGIQSHPECALKSTLEKEQADFFWEKTFHNVVID